MHYSNDENIEENETENIENDMNVANECNVLKRKLSRCKLHLKDFNKKIKKLELEVSSLKTFNFQLQEQLLKKTSSGNSSCTSAVSFERNMKILILQFNILSKLLIS